jgi:hypothetical protein
MNFTRKFNEFNEILLREDAGEVNSCGGDLIAILIVDFIAMAMSLRYLSGSIYLSHD